MQLVQRLDHMKKAILTLAVAGLCLAASADEDDKDGPKPGVGRVPDVVPTIGLVLMSVASLAVLGAYLPGKRGATV